jgi:hypothetical protein
MRNCGFSASGSVHYLKNLYYGRMLASEAQVTQSTLSAYRISGATGDEITTRPHDAMEQ